MDNVNHPTHYTSHPSGVETIQITEHMNFNMGNAIKYIMRADHKGKALEDLKKAAWYINREIERRDADLRLQVREPARQGDSAQHDRNTETVLPLRKATAKGPRHTGRDL